MKKPHRASRVASVARSDTPTEVVSANEMTPTTAKRLTLTGAPANGVGFKVLRSDEPKRITRRRSDEASKVVALSMPASFTDEQVASTLATCGLSEGYTVQRSDEQVLALRSDLKSVADAGTTATYLLNAEGVRAIVRSDAAGLGVVGTSKLSVVAVRFDSALFTTEQAADWLSANSVDTTTEPADNPGAVIEVRRCEVDEGAEVRQIEVETGVTMLVTRSEDENIPAGYIAVVNEAAYGNWGWGHLDFSSSMADREFCMAAEDATWRLRAVLDQITLYSELPLENRKQLIMRSCEQYGAYMAKLIDALPRQVLVLAQRADVTRKENDPMPQGDNVQKPDGAQEPVASENVTITRAELDALVGDAATKAAAKAVEAYVQRSATATETEADPATEPAKEEEPKAAEPSSISRSDLEAAMNSVLKPLVERIEAVEGTTVVRSDASDSSVTKQTVTRSLFSGCIPVLNTPN